MSTKKVVTRVEPSPSEGLVRTVFGEVPRADLPVERLQTAGEQVGCVVLFAFALALIIVIIARMSSAGRKSRAGLVAGLIGVQTDAQGGGSAPVVGRLPRARAIVVRFAPNSTGQHAVARIVVRSAETADESASTGDGAGGLVYVGPRTVKLELGALVPLEAVAVWQKKSVRPGEGVVDALDAEGQVVWSGLLKPYLFQILKPF